MLRLVYISRIYKESIKRIYIFANFFAVFYILNIVFVFIIYFFIMADWDKLTDRGNIEDRRGGKVAKTLGGISIVGLLMTAGISYLAGEDPTKILLQTLEQAQETQVREENTDTSGVFEGEDSYERFASTVL